MSHLLFISVSFLQGTVAGSGRLRYAGREHACSESGRDSLTLSGSNWDANDSRFLQKRV
jgi:hypothetical protein